MTLLYHQLIDGGAKIIALLCLRQLRHVSQTWNCTTATVLDQLKSKTKTVVANYLLLFQSLVIIVNFTFIFDSFSAPQYLLSVIKKAGMLYIVTYLSIQVNIIHFR